MKTFLAIALCLCAQIAIGQKYFSKTGKISFYSEAALEKIEAHNNSASTVIDVATGAVEWGVLIQGFKFEKALMQDHFNENYMESTKYPKAKFKGKIDNISSLSFTKDGQYTANISGQLEMHGVTQTINTMATIIVKNGTVSATSKFSVKIADYKIEVPKLMEDNIAKSVDIDITAEYQLLNSTP